MTDFIKQYRTFEPDDVVLVVHDNDPNYAGSCGQILSVDGIIIVVLSHKGKCVHRSYVPGQLLKLES
jgi:hypothetical protein